MAGNAVLPYTSGMATRESIDFVLCNEESPVPTTLQSLSKYLQSEWMPSQWRELLETRCYDLSSFGQDTNKESFGSLMPLWSSNIVQSCAMWQKDPAHSLASCLCPQFKPAEVLPVHRRLSWLGRGNAMFPPSCPVQNEAYLVATWS